jgi:cystathionine beta-lyase
MGKFDFDRIIDRKGTSSEKWDGLEKRFGAADLISMWVADMDFEAPPCVKQALSKRVEHGIFGYTEQSLSYYGSVTGWIGKRHNWNVQKEWICNTPGVVPALSASLMAFTQPGDGVVIQTPVYYPFFSVIQGRGRKVVENPLIFEDGKFRMDFEDLEARITPEVKVLFLCSPHNPTGRVWTRKELDRLARICQERDLVVVSDEIHSDIVYQGSVHTPLASVSADMASRTITCMSPSKTFNIAGLSTSVAVIPDKRKRSDFKRVTEFLHIEGGNLFGTFALEAAYNEGEEWLEELLVYLENNLDFTEKYLSDNIPGISLVRPEGTYVPLIDFRSLEMTGEELQQFLIHRASVAMDGGHWFGSTGEGFTRINIATPRSILQKGLEGIERAIKDTAR